MPWESLLIALLIAGLRTVDMSLDTVRITLIVQRRRVLASVIGFCEAVTFIVAAGIVFTGIDDPFRVAGYGVGFALGQYIGLMAAGHLRLGTAAVRIFSPAGPIGLADALRGAGFAVTAFDGEGRDGPVRMIHSVVRRRDLRRFLGICEPWRDRCYVTVGDEPVVPRAYPGAPAPAARTLPAVDQVVDGPRQPVVSPTSADDLPLCAAEAL